MSWNSIIRFKDASGKVQYGEPDAKFKQATVYDGNDILSLTKTDNTAEVAEVRPKRQNTIDRLLRSPDSSTLRS